MLKNKIVGLLSGLSVCCAGFTQLDLCSENQHPHMVDRFSVDFQWDDLQLAAGEEPAGLYFVATRILNTRHFSYKMNGDGSFLVEKTEELPGETLPQEGGDATPEQGQGEAEAAADAQPEMHPVSGISLPGGEYFMMTFSDPQLPKVSKPRLDENGEPVKDEENNVIIDEVEDDRVLLAGLDEFVNDAAVPVKHISMKHRDVKNVSKELVDNRKWSDLNPGMGYVAPAGRRLFVSYCDYVELNVENNYVQPFRFSPLTQHIDVLFTVQLFEDEEGNKLTEGDILDVYLETAGIAPEVSVASGMLNIASLKRTVVKVLDKQVTTETEDGKPVVNMQCKGSLDVFGLVGGYDEFTISGPGVFCFVLYVKTPGDIRAIYAKSNFSKKIRDLNLTEETGIVNVRRKLKDRAELKLETPFRIVGLNPEMGNDGICGWEIVDDIHVDI